MQQLTDEQYKKEYDEAMAKLEAEAAEKATPSRAPNGQFAKEEDKPAEETPKEPATEPAKAEAPAEPEAQITEPDPVAELKAQLEKERAEREKEAKRAADNQKWATKVAQELAEIKREQERREREAAKPTVLQQNPELEEAIRYVAEAPKPVQPDPMQEWMQVIEAAHPGIFAADADPELINLLVAKRDASNGAWFSDPLLAIREITEEKLAHAQRQAEKRLAAEQQKASQKSAMSVPGAGPAAVKAVDSTADEVKRYQNMSRAEFEKERKRVLGY